MTDAATPTIQVYWRPGCPYCSGLLRRLAKSGLPIEKANIWTDDEARAFVRRHAQGNETVPTVAIGDTVWVNPPFATVAAEAERVGIVPDPAATSPKRRLRRR